MKKIIIIVGALLFGSQLLGETIQHTVNICDRTPQVQEAIQKEAGGPCDKILLKKLRAIVKTFDSF